MTLVRNNMFKVVVVALFAVLFMFASPMAHARGNTAKMTGTVVANGDLSVGGLYTVTGTWSQQVNYPRLGVKCYYNGQLAFDLYQAMDGRTLGGTTNPQYFYGMGSPLPSPENCTAYLGNYMGTNSGYPGNVYVVATYDFVIS